MNNPPPSRKSPIAWWAALTGVILAIFLLGILIGVFFLAGRYRPAAAATTPEVTVVLAPTLTPVVKLPTPAPTPTSNLPPTPVPPPPNGAIVVGMYVQITDTGGEGLRLRGAPGTTSPAQFLGIESEVFRVEDGPRQADGFTWYYLVAPYDKKRAGWAVSNYLKGVAAPTQGPTP